MDLAVHYALLRDDLEWQGSRTGLTVAADGRLSLARVAAPEPGSEIAHEPPFQGEPSGIAADDWGRIFVADADAHRIVVDVPDCGFRYALPLQAAPGGAPGQFSVPAGLAVAGDALYVADRANARVQCFLLPAVELRRIIDAGLSQPTGVAVDRAGRVYVLDRGLARILRFHADGSADLRYAPAVTRPSFLALGADDSLYVSDETDKSDDTHKTDNVVVAFDPGGNQIGALALPDRTPPVRPRALAVCRDNILVADAASGTILIFDAAKRGYLGSVPGFRGPVSAMAFDANGDLLVKTDGGEGCVRLAGGAGCVETGTLVAGPLDAGVQGDWERVALDVAAPRGTSVTLETCTRPDSPAPADSEWIPSPSIDCLLARDPGPTDPSPGKRRFLWLRITLRSADGHTSPMLAQVQAQTIGESYLDLIPRIYRRDDRDTRFLERWLALFRSGIEAAEEAIALLPRRFDPATAPAEQLSWLAQALGFDPPQSLAPAQLRRPLARVPELYAQRGTIAGLEALAEIYAGIRPKIIEAYHARRVWQLEKTSLLGFDTALAASIPEGFIVPKDARTDPRYAGLHADYYADYDKGMEFDELVRSRTDDTVDFVDLDLPYHPGSRIAGFSVRWSGQIKPRYSETHTFHVEHRDGARLWIDGRLLVDDWTGNSRVSSDPRIVLDAGRWHAVQLEIRFHVRSRPPHENNPARLLWSSRSQRKQPVPCEKAARSPPASSERACSPTMRICSP
jgi:phage tail-like protein